MKAILTVLFILMCGVTAVANTNDTKDVLTPQIENHDEVKFSQMGASVDRGIIVASNYTEVETTSENQMVRLYKFKNARIKKALAFSTKRNKAKMA